jgi:hypothetical protein
MQKVAVWKTIEVVRDPDLDLRTNPHAKQPNDIVEGQFIRHRRNVPTGPRTLRFPCIADVSSWAESGASAGVQDPSDSPYRDGSGRGFQQNGIGQEDRHGRTVAWPRRWNKPGLDGKDLVRRPVASRRQR